MASSLAKAQDVMIQSRRHSDWNPDTESVTAHRGLLEAEGRAATGCSYAHHVVQASRNMQLCSMQVRYKTSHDPEVT